VKHDLTALLTDIRNGRDSSTLLLFGDDLQVKEARETILNLLIPQDQRAFNFERFDGRATPWDQIEGSLMTPPLLPGKKLVWVENAPYFFSRDQKGELGAQVLQLWIEGNKEDAAKLLIDLLVVEGWSQDQWERLESASAGPLWAALDIDGREGREDAEALLAYCKSRGLDLDKRRGAEGHRLFDLLQQGLPAWDFLLLTAVQVDRRTRLYKRFEELDAVLFLGLERDRSGKPSRDRLLEFVNDRLQKAGKTLEPRAREMILTRAGNDLRALEEEMNKLLLFTSGHSSIRAEDVEIIFADQGQGWIFDLTRSIADRDALAALSELTRLLGQGEHPLKLLATIAAEVRRLLAARQLIDRELRGQWKSGMSYLQFQQSVLKPAASLLTRNPYADYMSLQRADHFLLDELCSYMERIYETDLRLKSSGSNPRLVMERLILGMCLGARKREAPQERTTEI
jgi:DNA polymerase-3 subunit delta